MTNTAPKDAALSFAAQGWPVFPVWWVLSDGTCACQTFGGQYYKDKGCDPKDAGKHMMPVSEYGIGSWKTDATSDVEILRAVWDHAPFAGIGFEPGRVHMVTIDVDPRNGGDTELEDWEKFNDLGPDGSPLWLPPTRTSITGSGGHHYFYRLPEGVTQGSGNNWLPGVDIKSTGGYVVLPPSSHRSGQKYRWESDVMPVADLPPAMLPFRFSIATRSGTGGGVGKQLTRSTEDVLHNGFPEGGVGDPDLLGRDEGLFKLACRLRKQLGPRSRVEIERMVKQAASVCRPPMRESVAVAKVDSAFTYEYDDTDYQAVHTAWKLEADARMAGTTEAAPKPATRIKSGKDVLTSTQITWLVEDRIHQSGVGQFYAPSYHGKTLVALSLALAVANEQPTWFDHKLARGGDVLYVAMEGGPSFQIQIDAWLKANPGTTLERFHTLDEEEVNLADEESVKLFLEDIRAAGIKPVLVVFDTQIDVLGGVDEDSNTVMGPLLARMRQWAVNHDLFALLIHHTPHGAERPRGASSQGGKLDMHAMASHETGLRWTKVKGRGRPDTDEFVIESVSGSEGARVRSASPIEFAAARMVIDASTLKAPRDKILTLLATSAGQELNRTSLEREVGVGRETFGRAISSLIDEKVIEPVRVGRAVNYRRIMKL